MTRTSSRSTTEADRALALGALVRKLRRERSLTLRDLAERVPMSASNLSRIELGEQGPPADEIIERIGLALGADPAELLRAAGRYATGRTFEEAVIARLDALARDMRQVKGDVREVKTSLTSSRPIR
jgi:transcriptional regulator with XRE-family HTH domain